MDFVEGRVRADLDSGHMLRRAVKDWIQEIGEAATRISDAGRTKIPGLRWRQLVGMRHRIVHVYYDIDADALGEVAVRDLPLLANLLGAALAAWSDDV